MTPQELSSTLLRDKHSFIIKKKLKPKQSVGQLKTEQLIPMDKDSDLDLILSKESVASKKFTKVKREKASPL
jgi:hypothetical protein